MSRRPDKQTTIRPLSSYLREALAKVFASFFKKKPFLF
jgi:hypothetical protein